MKQRTQIFLVGAVLLGVAAVSSVKRGARCDAGSGGGGACCPLMSGLNLLGTNSWATAVSTNGKPGLTAGESITNRQQ